MRAKWRKSIAAGAALSTGLGAAAYAELAHYRALGTDRETGELVLYAFDGANAVGSSVDVVRNQAGEALLGIEGSTWLPGHRGMFHTFWTDEEAAGSDGEFLGTHRVNLVPANQHHDDWELAEALRQMEGGKVVGAASFEHNGEVRTFVLQRENTVPTYEISGVIDKGINPNNSPDGRFEFKRNGDMIADRDDLHGKTMGEEDENGHWVLWDDFAMAEEGNHNTSNTELQIRLKSRSGKDAEKEEYNENLEIVDQYGNELELQGNSTYNFVGDLKLRAFNVHHNHNSPSMGQWWFELEGTVELADSELGTLNRLVELTTDGDEIKVDEVLVFDSKTMDGLDFTVNLDNLVGLAGRPLADGQMEFYVGSGRAIYRIVPYEDENGFYADSPQAFEHTLSLSGNHHIRAMDFASNVLAAFDHHPNESDRFAMLQKVDGQWQGWTVYPDGPSAELGTFTFIPADIAERMLEPNSFD